MATVTPGAVYPIAGGSPFNTTPAFSGVFIPTLWSKKMLVKYYTDNQLAEIVNTAYEGEIKNQGDTVRIRTLPTLSVSDYTIGGTLNYEVPAPGYLDMVIDKGKYFAFQCHDVIDAQTDMDLMNLYTEDAAKQLKIAIADEVYFNTFLGVNKGATGVPATYGAAAANVGAAAGVKSGALNLGTPDAPVDATGTPTDLLNLILQMGAVLDEQNVPESGRWLLMSPYDRQLLLQSDLAKAYLTGDSSSIIRTGKVGMIDRFTVYVSNMLPRRAANKAWVSGQSDPTGGAAWTTTDGNAQRLIIAGTKDAISFASQFTKTETLRNPNDFGDYIRSLKIYGRRVLKPEALTLGVVK
jgi:hypothetical protein